MKNSIVFIILIFVNIGYIISRDFPKQKICFSVGANYNFFIGSFNKLPNVPNCCPEFSFGKGLGFNSNLSYRHIVQDKIWVGGKIGLITLDAEFRKEEPTFIITPQGLEEGSFEHLLRANLSNVFIQPFVEINLYKNLFFSFGLDFGYLFKNSFYQKETIIKPYGYGTFLDSLGNDSGKRYRNEYNGTIPNLIKNQNFVTIGLSYDLPLNKHTTLLLRPDVFFRYPFTNLVRDIKWRVSSLGGNLSLVFAPKAKAPKKRLKEQRIERDTIKIISKNISQETIQIGKENFEYSEIEYDDYIIELTKIKIIDTLLIPKTYILEGNVVAVGLDENGNEIPNPRFLIEEIVSNKLVPLLPYIFFEEGSSEIPKKYKLFDSFESAKNFNISELFYEGTIDIYHHILNIIGQRMRIYTDADLTLVGCNSDFGIERTNINLSKQRAIAIKEYLINVWGIAPHRIKIEARNLPEKPSIPTTEPEKVEENRRVELKTTHKKLLEWIYIEKIDRTATPPIIRFKPFVDSEAGLKNWNLVAYQNSEPNLRFEVSGEKQPPKNIDWKLEEFQKIIPRNPEPIIFSLSILDEVGTKLDIKEKTLPIEVKTIVQKRKEKVEDFELEKFSLILFDFDKATIEGMNKQIVSFINSKVKPNSLVSIVGYTDKTGESEYNRKLSEQRAYSVKSLLKGVKATAYGVGETILLYDNNLPEGRFYCRTVEVVIKNPIK